MLNNFLNLVLNKFDKTSTASDSSAEDGEKEVKTKKFVLLILEHKQIHNGVYYLKDPSNGKNLSIGNRPVFYTRKIECDEHKIHFYCNIIGRDRISHIMPADEFRQFNETLDKSQVRIELVKSDQRQEKYGYQVFQTPDGTVEATGIRIHTADQGQISDARWKFGADHQVIGTYCANDINLATKKRKFFIG